MTYDDFEKEYIKYYMDKFQYRSLTVFGFISSNTNFLKERAEEAWMIFGRTLINNKSKIVKEEL